MSKCRMVRMINIKTPNGDVSIEVFNNSTLKDIVSKIIEDKEYVISGHYELQQGEVVYDSFNKLLSETSIDLDKDIYFLDLGDNV